MFHYFLVKGCLTERALNLINLENDRTQRQIQHTNVDDSGLDDFKTKIDGLRSIDFWTAVSREA